MNRLTLYAIIFALVCTAALFASLIPEPIDCHPAVKVGEMKGEAKGIRETTALFTGGPDD